ncbi:MAG: ABC transporter permease [Bacteroidota bacterium]
MLKNYILTAFRNILRNPVYFMINLAGLGLGIGCCMMIAIFINHELSFDQFHAKKDRIYRVDYNFLAGENRMISPSVPIFVGPYVKKNFPEVEDVTRVMSAFVPQVIAHKDRIFEESKWSSADPTFFNVFDFQVLHGDLSTALSKPGTVVVTESTAIKYFGSANDALGKVIVHNNKDSYEVTAVIKDVPSNSHFSFDFMVSIYNLKNLNEDKIEWNNPNYATFVLLKPNTSIAGLQKKINDWVNPPAETDANATQRLTLDLESLNDVHFNTIVFNFGGKLLITDMKYIYVFSAIGLLVLIIACINYVNLATARATTRAREVGMRKSVGASFRQLLFQFLSESFLLLLPAVVLAVGACYLLMPVLQSMMGAKIQINFFSLPGIAAILATWIVLSVLSGFYPALILARFRPVSVLSGAIVGTSGARLRKGLVVVQFTVSMAMIAGAMVVLSQLNYMQSKKLGLEKENVVVIRGNADINPKLQVFMNSLRNIPGVASVAGTWRSPFETVVGNGFNLSENPNNDGWVVVGGIAADNNYIATTGMELLMGRNFEPQQKDTVNEFIVNEAFLRDFGLKAEEALGKKTSLGIVMDKGPGTIVGVVKDFHFTSLQRKIEPIVLFNRPDWLGAAVVRLKTSDMTGTLNAMEKEWKALAPSRPFNYSFLDDQYDALYRTEQRVSTLVTVFASVAIAIACLGLLGLASFTTMQRAKEISIRKALGATPQSIIFLLSKGYIRLMLVAFVIAVPLSAYLLNQWLEAFAYRISLGPVYFGGAFLLLAMIAFITVGLQSYKASVENPVNNLRNL